MTTHIELPRSSTLVKAQKTGDRGTQRYIEDQAVRGARTTAVLDGTQTPASHPGADAQVPGAGGDLLAEANLVACTQNAGASVSNFSDSHQPNGAPARIAVVEPSSAGSHSLTAAHPCGAPGGWLRDPVLGVLADVVDDLETVRIANTNRVRQLTRTAADKDGEERGFGLTLDHPEVAKLALTVKALEQAEHDAILNLKRALRKHPLAPFQKRHKGIGEKQLARLLAVIGDPFWNDLHERPRTVSELWAYCGFHVLPASGHSPGGNQTRPAAAGTQSHTGSHLLLDSQRRNAPGVAPKRARGQKSNWSEDARKRTWVIASAMPKFPGGRYEQVYRAAREKYADAVHSTDCVRCGPAGKPALAGTPLSDGHKHARAVRIVAKEILKDLWIEARDLYTSSHADVAPCDEDAPSALSRDTATAEGVSKLPADAGGSS